MDIRVDVLEFGHRAPWSKGESGHRVSFPVGEPLRRET